MTRRILVTTVALAMVGVIVPPSVRAARAAQAQATGQISGVARDQAGRSLPNQAARLRNVNTGQLAGNTTTNAAGQFSFTGLNPGNYIVEIVNAQGAIIGTSAPITLAAGSMIATGVAVTATAAGAAAGAAAAGGILGFFGTTAGIITGAAIAAGTAAAVVAARQNKVTICHREDGGGVQTIEIAESALPAHQAQGDTVGACPASPSR